MWLRPAACQGSPHTAATGAVTRLWTHLMADYYEEFAMSARDYVARGLSIKLEPHLPKDDDSRRLQELYGNSVITDDLLELWNTGDLSQLAHALPLPHGAEVPLEDYARLRQRFPHHIVTKLLVVDEHPVVTRLGRSGTASTGC